MCERRKDMLTGLEDNILSFQWVLVIVTNVAFRKEERLKLFFFSLLFSSCSQLCYGHKEMIKMDWHKVGFPVSFRDRFRVVFFSPLHFNRICSSF